MPILKLFDDKDGNGGGQMKSDDLRTMTTIGSVRYVNVDIMKSSHEYV